MGSAIFGDGAAAAVLWTRPEGLRIVDSAGRIDTSFREDVRYVYKQGKLHNKLSVQLPKVVRAVVPPLIDELLERNGLTRGDIQHWAIHPGGDRMVAALEEALELTEEQMAPTREVLAAYGNMSSPTVLFILKNLMDRGVKPGEKVIVDGLQRVVPGMPVAPQVLKVDARGMPIAAPAASAPPARP